MYSLKHFKYLHCSEANQPSNSLATSVRFISCETHIRGQKSRNTDCRCSFN